MSAAGTSGHGAELRQYMDLSEIGCLVVKSLAHFSWNGNPAPRIVGAGPGMLNSVGLQGPGIANWKRDYLPGLVTAGAKVMISVWGRTVEDFALARVAIEDLPDTVVAVEVNVSCPNLEDRSTMFAHSSGATYDVLKQFEGFRLPTFAKLSPNTHQLVEVAQSAIDAGATGITLVNTIFGMRIDTRTRKPLLGAIRGGLSGVSIHPVAVRSVFDIYEALPQVPIIGVGGVSTGLEAIELILAGASAVEVGTATFVEPRAMTRILEEINQWCDENEVSSISELIGASHGQ
ncbi:MAG: dihydroorotate dehydrogenase [Acidimicrobiaceae bacterium]|nr:dihydroorotate dehydrogenase [Acidimicrobiaceae bacterium]